MRSLIVLLPALWCVSPCLPLRAQTNGEARIQVVEVVVVDGAGKSLPPELEKAAYAAIAIRPGAVITRSDIEKAANAVFGTGFFVNVQAQPENTPLGIRLKFIAQPNPPLKAILTENTQVLDRGLKDSQGKLQTKEQIIQSLFGEQLNKTINLLSLQESVKALEKLYQDNGFVLAQVADIRSAPDGTITLVLAEGVIEQIRVGFLNEEGKTEDKEGKPIRGNTREFIITRELTTKPGDVLNRNTIQADLQRVFGLGIFEDVNVNLNPGTDPKQVIVNVNVRERSTGSISLAAGLSSATGLFGGVSFQQTNFGGNNQKVGFDAQVGERELLFDLSFTDPWIGGDPFRTSFSANIFSRRLFSYIFDNPPTAPVGIGVGENKQETPRENRLGAGFSFSRPLGDGNSGSIGLRFEQVRLSDVPGGTVARDGLGNPLSFSGTGEDSLAVAQLAYATDRRDDPLQPTSGSLLRVATEQALVFGGNSALFNRLRASYSFYVPVQFVNFTPGPQALAFNIQGGTIIGEFPPYEAFRIGGTNSVRGYDEGRIGSGKSFALLSAEYRFPIFSILNGVIFADYGTDLGTGNQVLGSPAIVRGKPGSGFGYGGGIRIRSPLGAIRIDYGIAEDGNTQISFGIGEKF
ncbi:MAG: BamA/TamA family outer membrane protein [Pseudanabaenaceae cyanobacterium SKYGB_i_bin29]|nr:BamA/TamA family outer membrane protein [Pseudanabaenaceae cyanobacterium SKYG29]MDW8420591.1 BamA/TamA family outer membrane protein [Pseudanabaenaceae cyanobacterium SKYGB_i_bin29]